MHLAPQCSGAKNARYYAYNDRAFEVMQQLIPEQATALSAGTLAKIAAFTPEQHRELYDLVGGRFFVTIPNRSYTRKGEMLPGTIIECLEMVRTPQRVARSLAAATVSLFLVARTPREERSSSRFERSSRTSASSCSSTRWMPCGRSFRVRCVS